MHHTENSKLQFYQNDWSFVLFHLNCLTYKHNCTAVREKTFLQILQRWQNRGWWAWHPIKCCLPHKKNYITFPGVVGMTPHKTSLATQKKLHYLSWLSRKPVWKLVPFSFCTPPNLIPIPTHPENFVFHHHSTVQQPQPREHVIFNHPNCLLMCEFLILPHTVVRFWIKNGIMN